MPTAFGESAVWVDGLLDRLEAYVVSQSIYPAEAIFAFLGKPADLLQNPPRDAFCTITPANMAPRQELVEGGGNDVPQFDSTFTFCQFARLWQDQQLKDARRLKDKSRGLAQAVLKLVKALQLWEAADDTTEASPLIEPGRLVGSIRFNGRDTPLGWASVESTWELKFKADLS